MPRQTPKKKAYDNEAISSLKGADRVRKRPGVIFGSDGLEGCEHAAVRDPLQRHRRGPRAATASMIIVTRYADRSIEVEDFGRGCPVDWNNAEQRYNWELVFCELYAGGKYGSGDGDAYEFSLGLNGLGSCATQYSSEYFDATIYRDGKKYTLHFEKGENVGGLHTEDAPRHKTGSRFRWKPDLEVFTDIAIPLEYYTGRAQAAGRGQPRRHLSCCRNQAGCHFRGRPNSATKTASRTMWPSWQATPPSPPPCSSPTERAGRDRADKDGLPGEISA